MHSMLQMEANISTQRQASVFASGSPSCSCPHLKQSTVLPSHRRQFLSRQRGLQFSIHHISRIGRQRKSAPPQAMFGGLGKLLTGARPASTVVKSQHAPLIVDSCTAEVSWLKINLVFGRIASYRLTQASLMQGMRQQRPGNSTNPRWMP